ncbi:MAG: SdrD B-like domain-containing protein, partial [Methanomassiliicoccales archaeon]
MNNSKTTTNRNRKLLGLILALLMLVAGAFTMVSENTVVAAEPSERFVGYNLEQNKWTTGDLGKAYTEGDFVSYQLKITKSSKIWGSSEFEIDFNFYQPSSGAIYVDGFDTSITPYNGSYTGFQVAVSPNDYLPDGQQLPPSTTWGKPIPVEGVNYISGSNPNVFGWYIRNYMDPLSGGDDSPGTAPSQSRKFTVYTNDTWPTNSDYIILFFRAHLALSLVWQNGLESEIPTELDGGEFQDWTAKWNGAAFATGSSRHFTLNYPGIGEKTIPIPIANYPTSRIEGHKYTGSGSIPSPGSPVPSTWMLTNNWEITLTGTIDLGYGLPGIPISLGPVLTGNGSYTTIDKNGKFVTIPFSQGYFAFSGLVQGTYSVHEHIKPQYSCLGIVSNGLGTPNVPAGEYNNFALKKGEIIYIDFFNSGAGKISGYKFHDIDGDGNWDLGEPGLANWTIELYASGGAVPIASTITNSNGYYIFDPVQAGNYTVKEVLKAGWYNTRPTALFVTVQAGVHVTDVNFANTMYGKICVQKIEQGIGPVANVTIELWQGGVKIAWAVTNETGWVCFENLKLGTYTVKEVLPA